MSRFSVPTSIHFRAESLALPHGRTISGPLACTTPSPINILILDTLPYTSRNSASVTGASTTLSLRHEPRRCLDDYGAALLFTPASRSFSPSSKLTSSTVPRSFSPTFLTRVKMHLPSIFSRKQSSLSIPAADHYAAAIHQKRLKARNPSLSSPMPSSGFPRSPKPSFSSCAASHRFVGSLYESIEAGSRRLSKRTPISCRSSKPSFTRPTVVPRRRRKRGRRGEQGWVC